MGEKTGKKGRKKGLRKGRSLEIGRGTGWAHGEKRRKW